LVLRNEQVVDLRVGVEDLLVVCLNITRKNFRVSYTVCLLG
jgi:hypothetical protein